MAFNNSTPLAAAKSFLAAIKTKDVTTMRKLSHPKGTACLIRNGTPTHMSIYEPIDSIGAAESDLDEVSYNEVEHVDGIYATVWTPYRFFEDGKLHHTGSNTFICWKSPDQGWIITAISDIARGIDESVPMKLIAGRI